MEQPFDDARFNFTKAAQEEALFAFQPARDGHADYLPRSASASPNLVLINVSPIEYGHVLLVPRVLDRLNQVVDQSSMLLALQFVNEVDDPYFRVGFNSLGAYGTINHLHFQVCVGGVGGWVWGVYVGVYVYVCVYLYVHFRLFMHL